MPEPRSWQARFQDIIDASNRIETYIAGMNDEEFLRDGKTFDAVVCNLIIVGEAIARFDADKRESMPHINWGIIVSMRNILVHEYFRVDKVFVWEAATQSLPRLVPQLRAELDPAGEASA